MKLEHILVPVDFGDSSRRAEEYAIALASKFGSRITLLHVWSVPTPSYAETALVPLDAIETAAKEMLETVYTRIRDVYPRCEAVLEAGAAWDRIVDAAEKLDADLIVIGTHGRRGVPRFFLGSVAEKVVRLSPIPVLTIGPERAEDKHDKRNDRDKRNEHAPLR
ncbi:Universal stress protein [Labilithrix luteola]|uniref:Universal stress protein n=1 Tax=Labilithrix luteola TaxID=1391654 RepID=A0A0K1PN22_9BACT|nr:universal stress protein [Labilithrix luteola]AKU94786.1 Universal stress protein [Labilithrix luteola]